MLVQFTVGNFRSFKEKVTISLVANDSDDTHIDTNTFRVDEDLRLLKTLSIYGKNAGGKSNFFKAFDFAATFIRNSSKDTQAKETITVESFRLSTETENKPSFFEFHFILDNILYIYGFEVDQQKVLSEWYVYYPSTHPVELFRRKDNEFKINSKFKEGKLFTDKTRENALFLSVVSQFNGPFSLKVLEFLSQVNILSGLDDNYSFYTLNKLSDPLFRKKILKFINAADLDIQDIFTEKITVKPELIPATLNEDTRKKLASQPWIGIRTLHNKYNSKKKFVGYETFDMNQNESTGTQKMFHLSAPIIDTLENGKTLVIDEFGSQLHPLLVRFIIELFNSEEINTKNAQLIFSSHSTNYLNNRFFRRDQIWFVEKDEFGASQIYSLDDFKDEENRGVRKDASYDKDFLSGRYGGIPFVEDSSSIFYDAHGKNKRKSKKI